MSRPKIAVSALPDPRPGAVARLLARALAATSATLLASTLAACGPAVGDADPAGGAGEGEGMTGSAAQEEPNTLTPAEEAAGWRLLFDGETLDGWRVFGQEGMSDGWAVVDGRLTRVADGARDIITVDRFRDFELSVDWMVEPGGNSGIFIRASEEVGRIFEGAPEMQVLDDERHVDGGNPLTSAGANYALHAPPEGVVRPAGEWNRARIRVEGASVTHWLNGEQVVQYELWTDEWKALVAASKFAEWPEYGTFEEGHIGLQDHGDRVYFRNIKVRDLE
jgi:hypothetical protein